MLYKGNAIPKKESKFKIVLDLFAGGLILITGFAALIFIFYSLGCFDK